MCELTKPNVPVKWLRDGEEMKPSDRLQISTNSYVQQLVIVDVTLDDEGSYESVAGDVSTKASLIVEGI